MSLHLRRREGYGLLVAGGLLAAGGLWHYGVWSRLGENAWLATNQAAVMLGLKLEKVTVTGRVNTPRMALLEALNVVENQSLLLVDAEEARARVEAIDWVSSAIVKREWPNRLALVIEERVPFAVWQNMGRFSVIDRTGAVLAGDEAGHFSHLPMVIGAGAPQNAQNLFTFLEGVPELFQKVASATWVGQRRWTVRLENGVQIHLPEENPAAAWSKLADYNAGGRLTSDDVAVIDLRLEDRMVIQPVRASRAAGDDMGERT